MPQEQPPATPQPYEGFVPADTDPATRQRELNARGFQLVASLGANLQALQEHKVMKSTPSGKEGNAEVFDTEQIDYSNWREVSNPGNLTNPTKLARVKVGYPEDYQTDPTGFVEVEIADKKMIGSTILPGNPRKVRVDVDQKNGVHVRGRAGGIEFRVDNPHPQSPSVTFDAANSVLGEAERAVADILKPLQPPEGSAPA